MLTKPLGVVLNEGEFGVMVSGVHEGSGALDLGTFSKRAIASRACAMRRQANIRCGCMDSCEGDEEAVVFLIRVRFL